MRELTSACSAMDDSFYAFVLFPIRWRVIMIFDFPQSPLFIIPLFLYLSQAGETGDNIL